MHCSSFEPLLDEFVDGTLTPRERALVSAHLGNCADCAALLQELRVIDALLLKPRELDPAPNFTFKTMAEVRSMPKPHVHHVPHLPVIGAYLAFAWTAIALFFLIDGAAARGALSVLRGAAARYWDGFGALVTTTSHLFGSQTLSVTAAMSALLGIDAVLALALIGYFYMGRARRVRSGEAS